MAVRAEIKAHGVDKLKNKLHQLGSILEQTIEMKLLQIAEEAVTYSKENKGYQDHTSNLKNSISFALFKDGDIITIHEGQIPHPEEVEGGQGTVFEAINDYANQDGVLADEGYTLIIVAGMEYGTYVEAKGYNVLYLTKFFLEDEINRMFEETIQDVMSI